MTLLVTGGAGFIGSNFVRTWLAEHREPIVNLDKLTYAGNLENLAELAADSRHIFVRGDIGDGALVGEVLRSHMPRAVLNFAAESHVDRSIHGPDDFIRTNVHGTFSLLESIRAHWSTLPVEQQSAFRLVHVSTDEVYGALSPSAPQFTEDSPHRPNSPYAASKAASDHLVRAWHHTYGIPVLTTNCGNNYGPFHFPEKLIPLVILNALNGKPLPMYGDGAQIRDWLFVEDHCRALMRVLEHGRVGETYAIGTGADRTNLDVVRTICALLDTLRPRADGASYSSQITFVKDRPGHDRRYSIDPGKIERELAWRPLETFETGIRRTIQWYLDHPAWVANVTSGEYRQWIHKQYESR